MESGANMAESIWDFHETPIGRLTIVQSASGVLRAIRFPGAAPLEPRNRAALGETASQLDEYFSGRRQAFDLDLEFAGTALQIAVWNCLREIPYGETVSYGRISGDLGPEAFPAGTEPHARARAVGAEVGRTPIPIVIPCHRVIGSDGSLTGYGGGLDRKRALLDLESSQLALL